MQSLWGKFIENYPLPDLDVMQDPKWPCRMQERITHFVGVMGKVMHGGLEL